MALEIERKFLLASDDWRTSVGGGEHFVQGYLCGEGPSSVRVRIEGEQANINIKAAVVGAARAEYEYAIPLADARAMLADLCITTPVDKTRHRVTHAGHTWEIDDFGGANAGLVVAEIELSAADEHFERPPWLGREVTHERCYYNHALALHPYRDWTSTEQP